MIDNNKIEELFKEKIKDFLHLEFYRNNQKVKVIKINYLQIFSIEKGKYNNCFNYCIEGTAEFIYQEEGEMQISDGDGQHYETYINVIDGMIVAIDRINIKIF